MPNNLASRLPIASCVMAIGALALAILSWAGGVRSLQPGLAIICLFLTIASLIAAIAGIILFRHGPRRLAVTAWIGLALCGFPMIFWALMILIILSASAGHPF